MTSFRRIGLLFLSVLAFFSVLLYLACDVKTKPYWVWEGDISNQFYADAVTVYRADPARFCTAGRYRGAHFGLPKEGFGNGKFDHNFLLPYAMAATWKIFSPGEFSVAVGRLLVGIFQVAGISFVVYFLAVGCELGWAFGILFGLLTLFNPWSLFLGRYITGESYAGYWGMAMQAVVALSLIRPQATISIRRAFTLFLIALVGTYSEYFFWMSLFVTGLFLLTVIAVSKEYRRSAFIILAVLMAGSLLTVAWIVIDYRLVMKESWFHYMHQEISGHQVAPLPRIIHGGWADVKEAWHRFPLKKFEQLVGLAVLALTGSFVMLRAKGLSSLWRTRWRTLRVPFWRLVAVTFLWGLTPVLWAIFFDYEFAIGPIELIYFSNFLLIPFLWIYFSLKLTEGPPRFWVSTASCAILLLLYLGRLGIAPGETLSRNRILKSVHAAQWDHYPTVVDWMDNSRLVWNVSHGHQDFRLRFPESLQFMYLTSSFMKRITALDLGEDGSSERYLFRSVMGIEPPTPMLLSLPEKSPLVLRIVDTKAQPMLAKTDFYYSDRTESFLVLVSSSINAAIPTTPTVAIVARERAPSTFERILDGSRRHFFDWTVKTADGTRPVEAL